MLGQLKRHGGRLLAIASPGVGDGLPQGRMGAHPVVLKDLKTEQGIPGGIAFSKGMRLARQGIEPIAQAAIEPFDMHRPSEDEVRSQNGADFERDEVPVRIAVFDRLRQSDAIGHLQAGSSPLPGPLRLAILVGEHLGVALPAVTGRYIWPICEVICGHTREGIALSHWPNLRRACFGVTPYFGHHTLLVSVLC